MSAFLITAFRSLMIACSGGKKRRKFQVAGAAAGTTRCQSRPAGIAVPGALPGSGTGHSPGSPGRVRTPGTARAAAAPTPPHAGPPLFAPPAPHGSRRPPGPARPRSGPTPPGSSARERGRSVIARPHRPSLCRGRRGKPGRCGRGPGAPPGYRCRRQPPGMREHRRRRPGKSPIPGAAQSQTSRAGPGPSRQLSLPNAQGRQRLALTVERAPRCQRGADAEPVRCGTARTEARTRLRRRGCLTDPRAPPAPPSAPSPAPSAPAASHWSPPPSPRDLIGPYPALLQGFAAAISFSPACLAAVPMATGGRGDARRARPWGGPGAPRAQRRPGQHRWLSGRAQRFPVALFFYSQLSCLNAGRKKGKD